MSVTSSVTVHNICNRQCVIVLAITKEDCCVYIYLYMEFEFNVNKVLPNTITFVDCKRSPFAKHAREWVYIIKYSMWVVINLLTCACTSQWRQKPRCILVESYYILLQFLLIKVPEWPHTQHPLSIRRIIPSSQFHIHLIAVEFLVCAWLLRHSIYSLKSLRKQLDKIIDALGTASSKAR